MNIYMIYFGAVAMGLATLFILLIGHSENNVEIDKSKCIMVKKNE